MTASYKTLNLQVRLQAGPMHGTWTMRACSVTPRSPVPESGSMQKHIIGPNTCKDGA